MSMRHRHNAGGHSLRCRVSRSVAALHVPHGCDSEHPTCTLEPSAPRDLRSDDRFDLHIPTFPTRACH